MTGRYADERWGLPVVAEALACPICRVGAEAAACRSTATSQWTAQSIHSGLTAEETAREHPVID